jgi:hypothetical protein
VPLETRILRENTKENESIEETTQKVMVKERVKISAGAHNIKYIADEVVNNSEGIKKLYNSLEEIHAKYTGIKT